MVNLEVDGRCFVGMKVGVHANDLGVWRLSNRETPMQLDQVNYVVELMHAQPKDAWVIVCGDFNFPRQSPAYQQMISQCGRLDARSRDPRPTYLPFPLVSVKWLTSPDYFFYSIPAGEVLNVSAEMIQVVNSSAQRPFQRFLTDHQALRLNIG